MKIKESSIAKKLRKAFTLAELLVVIVVLGILGAIAISIIAGIREQAECNQGQFNAATLARLANDALAAGVPAATIGNTAAAMATNFSAAAGITPPATSPTPNLVFRIEPETAQSISDRAANYTVAVTGAVPTQTYSVVYRDAAIACNPAAP